MLQMLYVDLTIYLLVMTGEGFQWSGLGVNVVGTEMGQGRQQTRGQLKPCLLLISIQFIPGLKT